jgi:hypothetical protein
MVAIAQTALQRPRGDQWSFALAHSHDDVPIDLTGVSIEAIIKSASGAELLTIETVLTDADDDRTGVLWVNQAEGSYIVKVNEDDTENMPGGCRLWVRHVYPDGPVTKLIQPLEVF